MGSPTPTSHPKKRPSFTLACGLFALIAFAQLMAVGVAVASRSGEVREIIRYRDSAPMIVSVPTLPDSIPSTTDFRVGSPTEIEAKYLAGETDLPPAPTALSPQAERPAPSSTARLASSPQQDPDIPQINDPIVEKLVQDAQMAHHQSDIIAALTKLEEAEALAPDEPAVFYRKAILFEDMGQWEKAADNYHKLFTMGPEVGVYYHRAALKLSTGINPVNPKQQLFVFGTILNRVEPDRLKAQLIIPVRVAPNSPFDPDKLEVKVHYYDIVDNKSIEPVPDARKDAISNRWLHMPADWLDDNEELIESSYTLPPAAAADAFLFGNRKYFGYVAELYYKNELLDQQAMPRRLHALHAELNNQPNFLPDFPDELPFDPHLPAINPDNPLLPALPSK